jgi:hypothetical protein
VLLAFLQLDLEEVERSRKTNMTVSRPRFERNDRRMIKSYCEEEEFRIPVRQIVDSESQATVIPPEA